MKVFIWNVNSWVPTVRNILLRHGSLRNYFDQHLGADIICLQEAKLPEARLTKEVACIEGFESFWSFSKAKQGYSGVTTYVRSTYSPLQAQVDCLDSPDSLGTEDLNSEGRLVVTDHGAFVLFNVYVPNAGDHPQRPRLEYKIRFLSALKNKMKQFASEGRQVVAVGDFNIASEPRDIHPSFDFASCYSAQEVQLLQEIMQEFPDVWRQQHPDAEGNYTVWDEKTSARAFNVGFRIDYVLGSRGLLPQVASCELVDTPPKWSDHAGMLLELLDIQPLPKHPPCELSSERMKRFNDRSQRSIFTAFGQKRPAARAAVGPGAGSEASGTAVEAAAAGAANAAGVPDAAGAAGAAGVPAAAAGVPVDPAAAALEGGKEPQPKRQRVDSSSSDAQAAGTYQKAVEGDSSAGSQGEHQQATAPKVGAAAGNVTAALSGGQEAVEASSMAIQTFGPAAGPRSAELPSTEGTNAAPTPSPASQQQQQQQRSAASKSPAAAKAAASGKAIGKKSGPGKAAGKAADSKQQTLKSFFSKS